MKARTLLAIGLGVVAIGVLVVFVVSWIIEPSFDARSLLWLAGAVVAGVVAVLAGMNEILELVERFTGSRKVTREEPSLPPSGQSEDTRWSPALTGLRAVLADLYSAAGPARRVTTEAGLYLGRIIYSQPADELWHDILEEALKQGKLRPLVERALAIAERVYGPEHATVANRVKNLGLVLRALGDLAGAKERLEQALRIDEKVYGLDHPTVANRANNLGLVLQDLGNLAGAKACCERALQIDEKVYGLEHPNVARDVHSLGGVLRDLGDLVGAKACLERALAVRRKRLGEDHPYTKASRKALEDLSDG